MVAPDVSCQSLFAFSRPHVWRPDGHDLPQAQTPVGEFRVGRAAAAWLHSLGEGLKTEPPLGFVVGEPSACKGLRGPKADGLLTAPCLHEGLQERRSSRNKVSGAVLPVVLPLVMTSGLFTLESCTTSILYNRSYISTTPVLYLSLPWCEGEYSISQS